MWTLRSLQPREWLLNAKGCAASWLHPPPQCWREQWLPATASSPWGRGHFADMIKWRVLNQRKGPGCLGQGGINHKAGTGKEGAGGRVGQGLEGGGKDTQDTCSDSALRDWTWVAWLSDSCSERSSQQRQETDLATSAEALFCFVLCCFLCSLGTAIAPVLRGWHTAGQMSALHVCSQCAHLTLGLSLWLLPGEPSPVPQGFLLSPSLER